MCVRARVRCARCVRSYSWMARLAGREEGLRRAAGREPAQDTEKTRARGADGGVESRPPREGYPDPLETLSRGFEFERKRVGIQTMVKHRPSAAGRPTGTSPLCGLGGHRAGGRRLPGQRCPSLVYLLCLKEAGRIVSFAGRELYGSSPLPEGSWKDRLLCRKEAGRASCRSQPGWAGACLGLGRRDVARGATIPTHTAAHRHAVTAAHQLSARFSFQAGTQTGTVARGATVPPAQGRAGACLGRRDVAWTACETRCARRTMKRYGHEKQLSCAGRLDRMRNPLRARAQPRARGGAPASRVRARAR